MADLLISILILLILGGAGGFLAGLLGIGGGMVFVLIFSYYLQKQGVSSAVMVPAIIANSMFAIFFAGLAGTFKQYRDGHFYLRPVLYTGIPASILSILFTWLISHGSWYTKEKFTLVFIALLVFMAWKIFRGRDEVIPGLENASPWPFALIGSLGGIIAAFSGIGGGVIMVPFFANFMHMPIRKATSVSLGVIVVMAFFTSIFNMLANSHIRLGLPGSYGLLAFSIALPVAAGSMIFSPVGVAVANKLSQRTIRLIFTLFLALVIGRMFYAYLIS